jgi:cytochrome c-type biogenesis protein CcmF
MFVNERTRQLMINPDIRKSFLADLYISPIEFDPGQAAGSFRQLELAKGEETELGDLRLRFVDFDLERDGNALVKMTTGERVTIAALVDVTRDGLTERVEPLFRFARDGNTEFPPLALPGGGLIALGGINATEGRARLLVQGAGAEAATPARLSLDVTRKPLVQLVWLGVYIVMMGGLLATVARVRQLVRLDAIPARAASD